MRAEIIDHEIVQRSKQLIDQLKELIAIPSPPGQEDKILTYLQSLLTSMGLATCWVDLNKTTLTSHPAFIPSGASQGRNLLAVWGESQAKPQRYRILFNAHVDAVPPGGSSTWKYNPYEPILHEKRIYGNGAADMKGGLASLLYAMQILIERGFKPAEPIAIELVIDEERLGNGTLANVLAGVSAEQAIFLEPSGSDCIVCGHRGAVVFRILVRGQGAELTSRGDGITIAEKLIKVLRALDDWKVKRHKQCAALLGQEFADRAPIYFGIVNGGHWFSAPLVEVCIDGVFGYLMNEQREDLEKAFRNHLSKSTCLGQEELVILMDRGFVEPSLTPPDSSLVTSLKQTTEMVLGNKPRIEPCINSGCDIRLRRLYDHNCQCAWYGPGGGRCHQSDEFVSIDELLNISRVIARWIITQC